MKHLSRNSAIAMAALLLCGAAYGGRQLLVAAEAQSTNDAFVAADFMLLSPKVGGIVAEVLAADNQAVKAGQLLVRIDDRDFQAALEAARAGVANAEAQLANSAATLERQRYLIEQAEATSMADRADLTLAKAELERYTNLAGQGAGTAQNAQQAKARHDALLARQAQNRAALGATVKQNTVLQAQHAVAEAMLQKARASQEQAKLDLSHTQLRAPIDGVVARRSVRVGAHVAPGAALLAVVPVEQTYVVANFQETQLSHVSPGQPVSITVDGWPGEQLRGKVESIAPATGATFSAIAPDNATGNFTKVVQRIPTRIVFDAGQPLRGKLRVGMSVTANVDTSVQPRIAQVGEAR
ncbi:HlyD family secretion protein [Massilia sp. NR 4-1]|uniref:HlyD family secretion protein n=1 Tax=Massilia sp. NR 4-1 TaxID=1678028 RepID=UPI00067BFB5C|nr:HlyD family secretion protein [Massilia sp. NR 4-1]